MLTVKINYITGTISTSFDGNSFEDFTVERAEDFLRAHPDRFLDTVAAGWVKQGSEWSFIPPLPNVDTQWDTVRTERNSRLSASDWTQLPDAPVDHSIWATYRQALRDITTQADPFNIVWPTPPTAG